MKLPPPDELAHGDFEMVVRRLADDLAFGMDASRFVGSGLEFAQSRPYQPGDSVRAIDWRLTARLDKPFVKEYETLKRIGVYIVVDTSASMGVGSTRLTKHDLAIWMAGGIGLLAQRRMSPVALVGAGERTTRIEPSLLRGDLWRALEPLRAGALDERTTLTRRLDDLALRLRRRSVIVVLSDLHEPDAIGALGRVAQRHEVLTLHLMDPAERGQLRAGFLRAREAESSASFLTHGRTAWLREGAMASELARSGVSAVRFRTDQPFIAPLRQFLAFRPSVGGGRS